MKFKVGDKVKIISDKHNYSSREIGDTFIIGEIYSDTLIWYREHKGTFIGVEENSLELVIENGIRKLQVGDSVRVIGNISKTGKRCNGKIGVITKIIKYTLDELIDYAELKIDNTYETVVVWLKELEFICTFDGYVGTKCNRIHGIRTYTDIAKGRDFTEIVINENIISNNKKTMSTILKFAKNLVLSSDEKLLRKYSLKDNCGEYTDEARELVLNKLIAENEKYFIEIATKMQEEENKNK